jgi:signal recognition particle subunit SEC65
MNEQIIKALELQIRHRERILEEWQRSFNSSPFRAFKYSQIAQRSSADIVILEWAVENLQQREVKEIVEELQEAMLEATSELSNPMKKEELEAMAYVVETLTILGRK